MNSNNFKNSNKPNQNKAKKQFKKVNISRNL